MSNHNRIDAPNNTTDPQVTRSNITGTTVGDKRGLDVNILDNSGANNNRVQKIFNETIVSADTEQSLVLPADIVGYMIRSRGNGEIKLTHVAGESGTKYLTIPPRATFNNDNSFVNLTLYFQSPKAGEIIEVVTWE